jgi:hypothetical protein
MIRNLRKRHLQVWVSLALLLPAGIIASWLVLPNQQPVKIIKTAEVQLLPLIVHTAGTDNFQVNIRTNNERSAWQLEWINKTVLTTPSAVIYKTNARDVIFFRSNRIQQAGGRQSWYCMILFMNKTWTVLIFNV